MAGFLLRMSNYSMIDTMRAYYVLFLLGSIMITSSDAKELHDGHLHKYCGSGTKFVPQQTGDRGRCVPCTAGQNFQNKTNHRETACEPCTQFDDHNLRLKLVKECTRFHDTQIECYDSSFYMQHGDCNTCTHCPLLDMVEVEPCGKNQNAFCCPKEGMIKRNGQCEEVQIHSDTDKEADQSEGGSSNTGQQHSSTSDAGGPVEPHTTPNPDGAVISQPRVLVVVGLALIAFLL